MGNYRVVVWDTQANEPYYKLYYNDEETAKQVARNLKRRYVDERDESLFEIKLQKIREESNA